MASYNHAARRRRIRNGEVIDLAQFRRAPEPEPKAPEAPDMRVELAKYLSAHAFAGITPSQMARDLLIEEHAAERLLDAVAAKGLLTRLGGAGDSPLYRRIEGRPAAPPVARGPFVQVRSDEELRTDRDRARRVGAEAEVRAAQVAKYAINDVVVIRGGRRRYVVARVEPNYGGEQTYYLVALSGGDAGSAPSGVREAEIRKDRDQTIRFEGVRGPWLQRRYVEAAGMSGGIGDPAKTRERFEAARRTVEAAGPAVIAPGVLLARRVSAAFNRGAGRYRGVHVSIAPGGKQKGVVWVTVGTWTKDSELRDKLHDAVSALAIAGLGEHVNSVEAYLGRIIVTAEPAPARNAERVWAELARVAENAERRGNPARPRGTSGARRPLKRNPAARGEIVEYGDAVRPVSGIARVDSYTPASKWGPGGYYVTYLHPDGSERQGVTGTMRGFVDEKYVRLRKMNPRARFRNHHVKVGGTFYTPGGRRGTVIGPSKGGYYPVRWSDGTLGSVRDTEQAAYPAEGSRAGSARR